MKGWYIGVMIGVLLVLLTAASYAQKAAPGPARPVPPLLRALDANGDGVLSAQEIAAAPEALAALDRDGDGSLSREDLSPAQGRLGLVRAWRRGFAAGRGFGAGWRFRRGPVGARMFGGGPWASRPGSRVGRPWLRGFHARPWGPGFGFRGPGAGGAEGHPGGPEGFVGAMLDRMFERFDPQGTGFLSKDAVPAPIWERLSRADADGDGKISRDELEKRFESMRESFRARPHREPGDESEPAGQTQQ